MVKIGDRHDDGDDFGVGEQMLNERHLYLDAVLAVVSIRIGDGPFGDDLCSQLGVDLDLAKRGLPSVAIINNRPAVKIPVCGTEDDKGVHFSIDLLNRLKRHCGQFAAEHPAGVRDDSRGDGVGQLHL